MSGRSTPEAKPDTSGWLNCPACKAPMYRPTGYCDGMDTFSRTDTAKCTCGAWSHVAVDDVELGEPSAQVVRDAEPSTPTEGGA